MTSPSDRVDLALRSGADTSGEVSRVLSKLEATGQNLTILRLLANAPVTFRPFVLLSSALLYNAVLPADVREVVILELAVRRQSSYEWTEHVPMARRAGVTNEQIDALKTTDDRGAPFSEEQQLALRFLSELERGSVQGGTWKAAVASWGEQGAIELVLTLGWWGGLVPTLITAFGLSAADVGGSVS
jgi:alkylhydroperoxidase family enzyme